MHMYNFPNTTILKSQAAVVAYNVYRVYLFFCMQHVSRYVLGIDMPKCSKDIALQQTYTGAESYVCWLLVVLLVLIYWYLYHGD